MTEERLSHTVPEELDGARIDRVLAVIGPMSRSRARTLVEEGSVTVNGLTGAAPSQRVSAGSSLSFPAPELPVPMAAEPLEFRVVFEDDALAVIDKPAGVVTHPGAGNASGTLAAGMLHRWPQLAGVGEPGRWGLVHRLDKGTSGLLVIAKTVPALADLQAMLRARRIARTYLALVQQPMTFETGTIDAPIERDPRRPIRRRVSPGGRPARTHYRQLATWPDHSLLEVELETGRTHQIRVHLAAIDRPVVGDRTYGAAGKDPADPGRLWLHSWQLSFPHPLTGEPVSCQASLPADLKASLAVLGEPETGTVL